MIPLPRASDAYRVWMCPRSHTALHTLVEFGLLPADNPSLEAESSTRQHQALAGEKVELSESEKRAVDESEDKVDEFLRRENLEHAYLDRREFALETDWWTGHIDRAVISAGQKTGAIFDYKQVTWGDHAHAADNPQLWVYVYLLASHYPIEQCWAVLQQPGHEQTSTLFDPKALKGLKDWAIATSQKALDPTAELKAGEWCEYCRLKALCPAGIKYLANTEALAADEELPVGNPIILGMLLDRFKVLSWFEDAIKNLSKILLRQDKNSVQGWKLQKPREVTVIKNLDLAYRTAEELGIHFTAWHKVEPSKLRNILANTDLTREEFEAIIDVVTEPGYLVQISKKERKQLGYE